MDILKLRIGTGVDFHSFLQEEGNFSIPIGGVDIPFKKKILAHSDGDVVLHALCDAIFGAISMGNIGTHFSPSDSKWKNASSQIFLDFALKMLLEKGILINADIVVICEQPKIMPFVDTIKNNLARMLQISPGRIGFKAITSEGMGFLGRGEGIGAIATCLTFLNCL